MSALPSLDRIRDLVARHVPDAAPEHLVTEGWQAATALVVAPGDGPELALIERVERTGDPWSGHMALPGGKRDPDDPDLAATAVRETREEVGLALDAPVGRLDDHHGHHRDARVATYVFVLDERPVMTPHPDEVADALWVPLGRLLAPGTATAHRVPGYDDAFPGLDLGGRVVWGLTHATLTRFARVLGLELPVPR
ncbi:NUDIX hydrolase [Egicoccus halophilus]|uniref:Coenzyme A pyrophosphatase n=1 Tax=Egicoccus halophilus TaxID=1670830 RepID=A0A8J3AB41_9ACTN|nr:CoA pyrophosphatase [Egicoccus halophilus]GGI09211.1 coenzyme A pyrophosphatase [Egicoccus halophilus]